VRKAKSDGLSARDLVDDLRAIKLPKADRSEVLALWAFHTGPTGPMSMKQDQRLRKLYEKHGVAIARLHEARERGRLSMAVENGIITKTSGSGPDEGASEDEPIF
jgi:hypothetical protein